MSEIGHPDDAESVSGNGTVIALLKRHRTLLASILASGVIGSAVVVSGRLTTAPAVATAAAPTYTEGSSVPLSTDLAGTLRTAAGGGGGGNPAGGYLDSVRNLSDGRLDSLEVLDSVRYLADGRLDSVQLVDSIRKISQLPLTLVNDRLKVNATAALATANPPAHGEASIQPLSIDLLGNLRVSAPGPSNTYGVSVMASAAAASKDHLTLFNQTGSGITVRVRSITIVPELAAAVTGLTQSFRISKVLTRGATCTNAPIFAYNPVNQGGIPAQLVGDANCTTDATLSGGFDWISCAVNGEETVAQNAGYGNCYKAEATSTDAMYLQAGAGLMIKSSALSGAYPVTINIEFTF